ncbi:MAG TPA: Na+/H+ antiporter subunit C [Desulfotomaculum sp.]|nr:Na+/H+ antiporter subunit C [Desulfotomaculum sp.]
MTEFISAKYNYWIYIFLMMVGFYAAIAKRNLVKKVIGLNIFQTAVFLFYISIAKVKGGTEPIWMEGNPVYTNPLPHVLILTAIVVAVSTTAVALAIIILIMKQFGTVEEDKILKLLEPHD